MAEVARVKSVTVRVNKDLDFMETQFKPMMEFWFIEVPEIGLWKEV